MVKEVKEDIKRLQTDIWGKIKESFETHRKQTGMPEATLVRFIMSEYYKNHPEYNK
jgi:hypothetical protein